MVKLEPGHRRQDEYERRGDELAGDYQAALVKQIREHAAEQVQRYRGDGVHNPNIAQVRRGLGERIDMPEQPECEHLKAAHRRQRAKPVRPIGGIAQRGRQRGRQAGVQVAPYRAAV